MKLNDIYMNKTKGNLIQIDSYATKMGKGKDSIIVFRILSNDGYSCCSFNGYGKKEEIENEYELLIPQKDVTKYYKYDESYNVIGIDYVSIFSYACDVFNKKT